MTRKLVPKPQSMPTIGRRYETSCGIPPGYSPLACALRSRPVWLGRGVRTNRGHRFLRCVEDCDLEPQVAQVYRAAVIAEADCPTYLGRLSANPYSPAGSPYSSRSVNNPYGPYGSPYSSTSARNPYATDAPKIVAQDGTYLGELSDNPYDPDSVANPYGRYGSPYSSTSIKNPYSTYGSPYSSQSPNNPYATHAPLLFGD